MFSWFKKQKKLFLSFYQDKHFKQISNFESTLKSGWSPETIYSFINSSYDNFVIVLVDESHESVFGYVFCSYHKGLLEIHAIRSQHENLRFFLLEDLLSRANRVVFNVHEKETNFLCTLRDKYKFRAIGLKKEYFNDLRDAITMTLSQTDNERASYIKPSPEISINQV